MVVLVGTGIEGKLVDFLAMTETLSSHGARHNDAWRFATMKMIKKDGKSVFVLVLVSTYVDSGRTMHCRCTLIVISIINFVMTVFKAVSARDKR